MADPTLIEYLTEPDPPTDDSNCREGSNSMRDYWIWPVWIKQWEDFELENIYNNHDELRRVLSKRFRLPLDTDIDPVAFCDHWKEDCVTSTIVKWNQTVVLKALKVAQEDLAIAEPYDAIYMLKGSQAELPPGSRSRPDWAGVKKQTLFQYHVIGPNAKRSENVLPGETKVAKKWCSKDIVDGPVNRIFDAARSKFETEGQWKKHWFPLRQICHYCYLLNSKYGYLLTNRELVVLKITPCEACNDEVEGVEVVQDDSQGSYRVVNPETPHIVPNPSLCMEYKAIPWDSTRTRYRDGDRNWTINLALFILHMLAKDDHRRETPNTSFGASSTGSTSQSKTQSSASDPRSAKSSFTRKMGETSLNGRVLRDKSVNGRRRTRSQRRESRQDKRRKMNK